MDSYALTRVENTSGVVARLILRTNQIPAAAKGATGLPPIIDRELFFGNPEIGNAQISPDGRFIAFVKPWKETRNAWMKKTEEPYDAARRITADPKRPIPGYFWTTRTSFS